MTQQAPETNVDVLCGQVMRGVVASGAIDPTSDLDHAVDVMRAEVKSLLFGDDYADERDCILRGSVSQQTVLLSVVASCVTKIRAHAA